MKKVLKQLHQVQENDFIIFKDLLLNCIKEYLPKTLNLSVFSDVFKNCDSIDYQNEEIVAAYVMLHLLDRYVRFQKIQEELLKRGFLEKWINMKNRGVKANPNYKLKMRILDVGTGPAPALFAFSDLYEWIKKFYNNKIDIKEDYIEIKDKLKTRSNVLVLSDNLTTRKVTDLDSFFIFLWRCHLKKINAIMYRFTMEIFILSMNLESQIMLWADGVLRQLDVNLILLYLVIF